MGWNHQPPTSCRSQLEQQLYLEVKIENLEAEVKLLMKAVESKQKQASRRTWLDAVDGGDFCRSILIEKKIGMT